jgi:GNAT superfamily N-acetyltransferase
MGDPIDLANGRRIEIRPIGPGDRNALAQGFERLGSESRYLRFFGSVDHLSEDQLTYLTEVDHHDHEALVALDLDTRDGVGVARFVKTADEVAEPAVAVADDWQRSGVGTGLLEALAQRAREEGVRTFAAYALADNAAVIALLAHLGPTRTLDHGREVELLIALDENPGTPPGLHHLLRHAAERVVRPSWRRETGRPF